jgi:hypothetical protein
MGSNDDASTKSGTFLKPPNSMHRQMEPAVKLPSRLFVCQAMKMEMLLFYRLMTIFREAPETPACEQIPCKLNNYPMKRMPVGKCCVDSNGQLNLNYSSTKYATPKTPWTPDI